MIDERHDWTHPQCTPCWMRDFGLNRAPHRVMDGVMRRCCFCGRQTATGIFRRMRPGSIEIASCPDIPGVLRAP